MPTDTADSTDTFRFAAEWGPWKGGAPPAELRRSVAMLYALSSVICGPYHALTSALSRADMAPDDALGALTEALAEAAQELERLPALTRRRLLSSYGTCIRKYPDAARRVRPTRYEKAGRKGAAA